VKRNETAPVADETSNRDRIVNVALRLLTERGYENVSMRDIASAVGIKASSIYNHFSGKDAIIDELVVVFRKELAKRSMNEGYENLDGLIGSKGPKALLTEIMLAPLSLLEDPVLRDVIKVVTHCQYHHEGIRTFLRGEMFDKPQALLRRVLVRMRELGLVEDYPADFLVVELQAVMTASFYQLSLDPERPFSGRSGEILEKTKRGMAMHVDFFWRAAGKY